jgi:hypothetical protein
VRVRSRSQFGGQSEQRRGAAAEVGRRVGRRQEQQHPVGHGEAADHHVRSRQRHGARFATVIGGVEGGEQRRVRQSVPDRPADDVVHQLPGRRVHPDDDVLGGGRDEQRQGTVADGVDERGGHRACPGPAGHHCAAPGAALRCASGGGS